MKFARTAAMVVGAVALIATGVGAVAGGTIIGTTVGAFGPTAITLGQVASAVTAVASIATVSVLPAIILLKKAPYP